MRTSLKALAVAGLMAVVSAAMAEGPELAAKQAAPRLPDVTYTILPESFGADGCATGTGLWPPCPKCPILFGPEFTGTITLTPHVRVMPGHRTYDVTIEDWMVTFGYDDEPAEVTGQGTFDRWTWTDGTTWQIMTLDLEVYGETVHFSSGVVEDPHLAGSGTNPDIEISLASVDTGCWGYWFFLEAEYLPAPAPIESKADATPSFETN